MKRRIVGGLMALILGVLMQAGATCFSTGSGTTMAGGGGPFVGTTNGPGTTIGGGGTIGTTPFTSTVGPTPVTGTVGTFTGVSPLM